jgi:hypothetical protein
LPLIVLHDLVRRVVVGLDSVSSEVRDEIWLEIPLLLSPLQQQVRRLSGVLDGEQRCVAEYRLARALDYLQRVVGDRYWMTLDAADPQWLERRFDVLCRQLALDGSLPGSHALAG